MMPLWIYWLLLVDLAVNINAKTVYSYGSQYGTERETLFEAESSSMTSKLLPQDSSCSGVKGHGPCLEMASTGGSNGPSFQAAASSGVASPQSRHDFMQLGDTSPLISSSSVSGLNLDQNWQPVQTSKNANYDPSSPRVVKYGPVFRLLKPHVAHTSSRIVPSPSYKPPIGSTVTSQSGQNGSTAGLSQRNAYNAVAATHVSRNKPLLSSMVITSSPMITFIMPNQSDYQLVQTINKTLSSHEPGTSIKPLVTANEPTAEISKPFELSQEMIYRRPPSQPRVPNKSRYKSPQAVRKLIYTPKSQLARKNPSTVQSKTTEQRFTQLGNPYNSADKAYKTSNVFKAAHNTYHQQISKPVQSGQQLADFSQSDLGSTLVPSSGSVYRFARPGYVHGISGSSSRYVPSGSAKTGQSNFIQRFYKPALSFPKVGYGSPSTAVASSETRYDFTQAGNASSSASDDYTLHSQPTSSSSNLFHIPYFLARQGRSSMFKPLQPNYKSFPTRYMEVPPKSFNTHFSALQDSEPINEMRTQESDVQSAIAEGFQTRHTYDSVLVSNPVQHDDQGRHLQNAIRSHPRKTENRSDYLLRLLLPSEQSVANIYNQPHTGQSSGQTKYVDHNLIQTINSTSQAIQSFSNPAPLPWSQGSAGFAMLRPVSSEFGVDQATNHLGVLAKPFQHFFKLLPSSLSGPESQHVSSENWYGPSQLDSAFALRASRPILNFQKV